MCASVVFSFLEHKRQSIPQLTKCATFLLCASRSRWIVRKQYMSIFLNNKNRIIWFVRWSILLFPRNELPLFSNVFRRTVPLQVGVCGMRRERTTHTSLAALGSHSMLRNLHRTVKSKMDSRLSSVNAEHGESDIYNWYFPFIRTKRMWHPVIKSNDRPTTAYCFLVLDGNDEHS